MIEKNIAPFEVRNGNTTEINLEEASKIESARVRWQGIDSTKTVIETEYVTATNTNNEYMDEEILPGRLSEYYPENPSGTSFQNHSYLGEMTIYNESSEIVQAQVEFRYKGGTATESSTSLAVNIGPGKSHTFSYETNVSGEHIAEEDYAAVIPTVEKNESQMRVEGYIRLRTYYNVFSEVDTQTENPRITVNSQVTQYDGILQDEEWSEWLDINGLEEVEINEITHNIDNSQIANIELEYSYQKRLPAIDILEPNNRDDITDRRPYIVMQLPVEPDNDSENINAKIKLFNIVNSEEIIQESDSRYNDNWELYQNEEWISFPSEGVTPGSTVRTKLDMLEYQKYYYTATPFDGWNYGYTFEPRNFTVTLNPDGLYTLDINGKTYDCYSLVCSETSNGELGNVEFEVNNKNNQAFYEIESGGIVTLAVMDYKGNIEQFTARVRVRNPQGEALRVAAITGDGILADRIIREDYPSQDVGLTLKQIVDTYCSPLTTNNIDTNTGSSMSIKANSKRPIQIFEEIRRKFGLHYYVDKDWDVHLYSDNEISNSAIVVRRGG